jgi:UDP:flavonoid glycosyltransferase YjiC (YdhE family)
MSTNVTAHRALVHQVAESVLRKAGKVDSYTEDEYLKAVERIEAAFTATGITPGDEPVDEDASIHNRALFILAENGKTLDSCTQDEYLAALDEAGAVFTGAGTDEEPVDEVDEQSSKIHEKALELLKADGKTEYTADEYVDAATRAASEAGITL